MDEAARGIIFATCAEYNVSGSDFLAGQILLKLKAAGYTISRTDTPDALRQAQQIQWRMEADAVDESYGAHGPVKK